MGLATSLEPSTFLFFRKKISNAQEQDQQGQVCCAAAVCYAARSTQLLYVTQQGQRSCCMLRSKVKYVTQLHNFWVHCCSDLVVKCGWVRPHCTNDHCV
ncbi:hypothetical protein DUNSADRAFT_1211 [Dunaliella salina]|uniref:Encoded protein n=1 Tax=Dunaliella salina TaxID=3046 RepID=A0ABQ7GXD6_DUNSA|nr:hypothetical protein DUNSADRAFT_1211 [Dunaliella salina]|eukprot:KAF5839267.1 hypothetical protein DUNSADRAFT_1211 [Dunaliella salina]